ncbi:tetratricopeptide repeat protein [Phenylobacterium sp.]|jgi:Flp pilus assembly protein TadD|uniref:tetratricopeptide repeat protein n=1 Tax=Phenylobacterium sp. TaxID=1871053 RepID=UPI0037845EBB
MRRLLLAAPLLLLAACAGARSEGPPPTAAAAEGFGASPYGMFLAGQAALNDGRSVEAARYFEQASAYPDTDGVVAERAFSAAVLAGDIERAVTLAPQGPDVSEATKRLAALTNAVEAIADGRGKAAQDLLSGEAIGFPHRPVAALLAPWAAAQAGDTEAMFVRPQVRGDRVVDYFGQLGRAQLFERARRFDEAETDYKAASASAGSEMSILAYGAFLERQSRRKEAVELYDTLIAAGSDGVRLTEARARATAGRKAPALPSLKEGAAQALLAPAATMLQARQTQLALLYLRLALRLDPKRDEAWVMLGDVMQAAGDADAARAAYARLKPGSPEYASAQAKLAWTYQSAKDPETALKLARAAAATGDVEARVNLADLLRADERHAEAVAVLNDLIGEAKTPDWRLHYARGVALERLGRWPEAENDLTAALKARPDEPELLNYLGYSWIDRGERLAEALAMVEKAVAANPRSGAMVDSLGWAHYRMGDYKKAVETLERAVGLEAGDPEINNHLGDAYWMVGRKDEAVFQWRRVLTLDPEDKIRADAESKIASGLGPTRKIAVQ